ncbi:leucine-rich repeat and WD repeat-containing protein 1-like isoform X1 [Artemia franciscana]|uniref:leucine-rich repeat and WD repeat-containing protein 1-like isoform X1 n=2 Tax=Artemia franciscana TaxID=6661 RepID=UPI0032DB9AC7
MTSLTYCPLAIFRGHSKINDPSDSRTQIWGCQFSPNSVTSEALFATCGGYSCCVFDALTQDCIMKFEDGNKRDEFYALSWSFFEDYGDLILAIAGAMGTIHTLNLVTRSLYQTFTIPTKVRKSVYTLLFDKENPSLLYAGAASGKIYIWHVVPPSYGCEEPSLLRILSPGNKETIRSLTEISEGCILASYDNMLMCFKAKCSDKTLNLQGPVGVGIKTEENFIDSVVYVDNFLAVKTSGEDYISVFTLPPLDPFPNKRPIQFSFFNTLRFRKASREDVFMDGSKDGSRIVACGDDEGTIWLYDMKRLELEGKKELVPDKHLQWPKVDGINSLDEDCCINRVCFSPDSRYIVSVTVNNLVCLWAHESLDKK